jgi:hypothetical protein
VRRRAVVAAIVAVVLVGVAVWRLLPHDTATPIVQATGARAYTYRTAGFEQVDAFGGARHDYPRTTAILVRQTDCGVVLTWRPLEERMTSWELCRSERGWLLRGFSELHTFFGRRDRRIYRCRSGSLLVQATCSAGDTTETAEGTTVGTETLTIGGRQVETLHLSVRTRLDGKTRGTGTRELWLRSDGLPVRWILTNVSATPSFVGDVHYRERFELTLVSLEPRAGARAS